MSLWDLWESTPAGFFIGLALMVGGGLVAALGIIIAITAWK
jgi:hypothetical protein